MVGRIVTLEGTPTAIAQAKEAFASQGASILKGLPGLQHFHVFFGPTEAAVITVWQDASSAMAAVAAMGGIQQKMLGLGLALKFKDYDVLA